MPRGISHDIEYALNVIHRNVLVEQVAHGVYENAPGLTPGQREMEHLWLKSQPETVRIVALTHGLEAARHSLCVAMFASGTNLRAAGYWIPGSISPFNPRIVRHQELLGLRYLLNKWLTIRLPISPPFDSGAA